MSDSRIPGFKRLVDVVIDPVDHGAGLAEEHDLIGALDLPGEHHGLLSVGDLEPFLLQGKKDRSLRHVDPQRIVGQTLVPESGRDLGGGAGVQSGAGADRSLETGVAPNGVLGVVEAGQLAAVCLGGRAEVPDARPALCG